MSDKAKSKKIIIALIVIGILVLLYAGSFIPTFFLKSSGMQTLNGGHVTLYYKGEETVANDVLALLSGESVRVAEALGLDSAADIDVYLYESQSVFHTKMYGFLAMLRDLDDCIGDHRDTNVLLASPEPGHDSAVVTDAAVSEMIHVYNSILWSDIPLWIDEALTAYLTDKAPRKDLYDVYDRAPSLAQTRTNSISEFEDMDGYAFSYTYIEYLEKTYGWEAIIAFLNSHSYEDAFGVSEEQVHSSWVYFLQTVYNV